MEQSSASGGDPAKAFAEHSRNWHRNLYVYPVLARRSRGLSIGVNLNPDKVCNFDCIYCQVDRTVPPIVRKVDLAVLREELGHMLRLAASGELFAAPPFDRAPEALRRTNDIAFSGDGEPTACPQFAECVGLAAELKGSLGLRDVKIVLITDACFLARPAVRDALAVLDRSNGEIWAKLDAGTEEHYRRVNRPSHPLRHVLDNILDAARVRPVVIQSLWMRIEGRAAPDAEVEAFADRLNEILSAGGQIKRVQIYTVARRTAEAYVEPLANADLDRLASIVRGRAPAVVETFYGSGG